MGAGCAGLEHTATRVDEVQPAVIKGNGSCHEAIENAMKAMTASNRIRLSPDAFRTQPQVLLSNYRPTEVSPAKQHPLIESADRQFLLHIYKGRCWLSLVDADGRLTATRRLDECACVAVP